MPIPAFRATISARARRLALGATLAAAATLSACARGEPDDTSRDSAGGEVAPTWTPDAANLDEIRGVPVAAVRQAIAARLEAERPSPITEDQWRHAKLLYKEFGGAPLWMDGKGIDEDRGLELLRALVDADKDALRLDLYPLPAIARAVAESNDGDPTPEQLAEADVLFTSAYAALLEDLLTGQVNPRSVSQDWHIDPKEEAVDSAIARAFREPRLDRAIAAARPQAPDYEQLRQELVRYRDLSLKGGWPTVPEGRALKPGETDRATRLQALRARLEAEGLMPGGETASRAAEDTAAAVSSANAIGGDSSEKAERARPRQARAPRAGEAVYDEALAGAVAAYQARHAIVVDSVLGEETVKSMNLPVSYRLAQIASNLERHRWMPRALGERHIVVNVPAFHLSAFEGGKPALEMKVIVGEEYEDRRTAVFADTMRTVVFRPYWFVTDDIAEKELWPKINADPSYLERNDYETFEEGGKTRIRQKPGPDNSLGLVKFLFPNSFNIYLHDTPQPELFKKDVRAFSHGCIRLEKPAELAQWVLGWTADSVKRAMETPPDDKSVKVPRGLPVYITYFTTYVQDGQLRWGNDLYDRDSKIVEAMRAKDGQPAEVVQAVQQIRKLVD